MVRAVAAVRGERDQIEAERVAVGVVVEAVARRRGGEVVSEEPFHFAGLVRSTLDTDVLHRIGLGREHLGLVPVPSDKVGAVVYGLVLGGEIGDIAETG
jgi:hypothetical protein